VAICAIGFTIFHSRQNHKHNKLSVQPIFDFERKHIEGKKETLQKNTLV
jgi:hypothetical protein